MSKSEIFSIISKLLNIYYNKCFNKAPIFNTENKTHLQKFLIDICNNLDKTKLCPFCGKKLTYAEGYSWLYDEHITFFKYVSRFGDGYQKIYFKLNDKEIEIFPFDIKYNEFQFSDWYDHYVGTNKTITVPEDMIFNSIQ